jgi:hypothetical protein
MHREKCAWGQTGQKNVMALLVLMADLVCALSASRYRHITIESRTDALIARMTSSRLRDYETRNVKMARDDRCSR